MKLLKSIYYTCRFWVVITLLSIVFGLIALLVRVTDSSGNRSHQIARLWSKLLCTLNGIKVEIKGLEYADANTAQIFVANHQSFFDIFALSGYIPLQIRWMAKASLFRIPFVGWAMRAAGYISVERENKRSAYKSFLTTVDKLKSGNSIVIFPEGTRSLDGKIGPFKKGSQLLAIRSGAPMVPVAIIGTGNIIKKGSGRISPGPVRIILMPPVSADKSKNEDTIIDEIRTSICKTFDENKFQE
ncbi:MAG: acyl-phosphate glycerol 3-phosphate acyltransferase [Nitrospinae bacterium RIFCSPLOWO2_12_FULL_47_7]|nr:MAG: acyl-phosphate glycerol 3-phosphate acyltransferase [Nitrospinae bacterium RIFCSPLOWO2_12_FULL_47_7]